MKIQNILFSFFVFCLFFNLPLIAQSNWARTYAAGGLASVEPTSDGGYIAVGDTVSFGGGGEDVWLVKVDYAGNVQFEKTFGGTDDEWADSIQETSDGGYIVVGTTHAAGMGAQAWLLKLDATGSLQLQKSFGGTNDDVAFSVIQTSDGGYFVAGGTLSFGAGDADIWVMKLDASLNIESQRTFGSASFDLGIAVTRTSDGGFLFSGLLNGDVWLAKLNSAGNIQWQETLGGTGFDAAAGEETSDGGYILAGASDSFSVGGDMDVWVIKLDSSGNVQFQKDIGGSAYDEANSVHQTPDGGYLVSGIIQQPGGDYDGWLLKLNSSGNIQFQKDYGSVSDNGFRMQVTPDGGAIMAAIGEATLIGGRIVKVGTDGMIGTSCSIIKDNSFTATDTSATPEFVGVTPVDSNATVITTTATTSDTATSTAEQCSEPFLFAEDFDGTTPPPNWTYTQAFVENNGVLSPATKKKSTAIATPAFPGCQQCTIISSVQYTGIKSKITLIGWSLDSGNELELLINSKKLKLLQRSNNVIVKKQKVKTPLAMNVPHTIAMRYDGTNVVVNIDGLDVFPAFTPVGTLPAGTLGVLLKGDLGNAVDYFHVN